MNAELQKRKNRKHLPKIPWKFVMKPKNKQRYPTQQEIDVAMEAFLQEGKKITVLPPELPMCAFFEELEGLNFLKPVSLSEALLLGGIGF